MAPERSKPFPTSPVLVEFASHNTAKHWVIRQLRIYEARNRGLGCKIFFDPPWVILLHSYMNECNGITVDLQKLAEQACLPVNLAARWLAVLLREGLLNTSGEDCVGISALGICHVDECSRS